MQPHRHTIYDAMEAKGLFANNPANPGARDPIEGVSTYMKQEFPRMVYSPTGERRVVQEAEILETKLGVKLVNEKTEIKHKIVQTAAEFKAALAEGWHATPAKAMKAGGEEAPASSATEQMEDLQDELAGLRAKLAEAGLEAQVALLKAKLEEEGIDLPAGFAAAGDTASAQLAARRAVA